MKARWIILWAAGLVAAAVWIAAIVVYFFFEPSLTVWAGLVTAAAVSLEAFLWIAAGVFGWSFLAGRRQMLGRLRRRLFGRDSA